MRLITESERLKLLEFTNDEVDLYYQITSNKQVMKFFKKTLDREESQVQLDNIVRQYTKYGYCFWKVLLKPDEHFIGICGLLYQIIDGQVETEIAYRLLPEYWGVGYATEAAVATREYAKHTLGKKRLISLVLPENIASQNVALRAGASEVDSIQHDGLLHKVYLY